MDGLFDNCLVDIEGEDFVEQFRSLHRDLNVSFGVNGISDESIIKYIVASYDISSPFVVQYSDWAQRRRETGIFAQFPTKGREWIEEAENIVRGRNQEVNQVAIRYMFLQNNLEFIQLMSYQKMLEDQVHALHGGSYGKPSEYDKLKQNIDNLTKDIKQLQRYVFSGEEWKEWRNALYNFVSVIRTDISPEDVADKLQKGEPVVDDVPYPNYEPEELRFIDDK